MPIDSGHGAVLIAAASEPVAAKWGRGLRDAGHMEISRVVPPEAFIDRVSAGGVDVLVVHAAYGIAQGGDPLEEIAALRRRLYRGIAVVVADRPSIHELVRAFEAGADDYVARGVHLDIADVVDRLWTKRGRVRVDRRAPEVICEKSFLRSLGLTESELWLLSEFARDFPRQRDLAARVGRGEVQVRKAFSRIYEKLSDAFEVDNPAQLAHLLTVGSLYG